MIDEKRLIEDIEKEFDGMCVYDVSPSQAVADFVEIVDRQPKVGEWIPCSERLPKITDDYVLITMEKYYSKELCIEIGYIEDGKWKFALTDKYIKSKVIAWCELPKPYKGD